MFKNSFTLNRVFFIVFPLFLFSQIALLNNAKANNVIGQWELITPSLPYFPVHANLLPNGKVMIWPGDAGISGNDPRSWDPADNSVTTLAKPGYDLFCVGHVSLADGSLFLAGGHISNFVGLPNASKYDYLTDTWTTLPNMNAGRWYPTTTVLGNGDVLTISGDIDTTIGVNPLPQVLQVSSGTWRNLTSAQMQLDDYPRMFLSPNGKVFYAGASPTTRYLNTSGTGAWSFVATRQGGYRDYGTAVMYAPGKIITMGGDQQPPKNSAEVIDLNKPTPSWRTVAPMKFNRRQHNATLLPDGKILVTGGTASSGFNDPAGHVDAAEMWDPATEQWTTLASSSGIPRVYHSTALLLPDGRVFSTGGNDHPEVEIFSPPYLFKGARPTITSAPLDVQYGNSFLVTTPNAASISKVTVIRIGSVTHSFNMGQVINELSFTATAGGLNITAPSDSNVAPPGYYMLFILNGNGVPSIAKFVKIGAGTSPSVSITAPQINATVGGTSVTVSADAEDNVGVVGVQFKVNGNNIGAEDTTSPFSVIWNSTTVPDGPYTITATARDADGNTRTSAGVNVSVNNTSLSPDLVVTDITYANGVFTSTVKNQGTAPTPSGAVSVAYLVNDEWKAWGGIGGAIAPGQSVTIGTSEDPYVIPSGNYSMTAHVNDRRNITELDYSNNILSKPVTGGLTDVVAPTVTITAPNNGVQVSGTNVIISANATDNVGVSGVQFSVSGAYPIAEDTVAPYSIVWDSTTVSDGPHTITAIARDAAGNSTTVAINVTVANNGGGGGDTTKPTVAITSPAGGATVSGASVNLSANASDNVAVVGVKFSVSGGAAIPEDTTAPYSVVWNSNTVSDGAHTITAVARDAAGNTETTIINVTVNNATGVSLPDVVVTNLSYNNGIFTSVVKNQGSKAVAAGVNIGVGYSVDGEGKTWGSVAGPLAAGASVTIGTDTDGGAYIIPSGNHSITADVDDVNRFAESNEGNNQLTVPITVGNSIPTVSITSPSQGNTVAGTSVNISASATDNVGVAGVQFKIDGTNLGNEDTVPPYAVVWNTTNAADGPHSISAVVRDTDGNTATAAIDVTVNNATGVSLPDVVVTNLSYSNGIFTSVVKNQGSKGIAAGVIIGVGYSVDGEGKTWGSVAGPLAAGASVTIGTDTDGGAYIIPSGNHSITADVDDVNRFAESNEGNNQLTKSIAVP